MKLILLLLAANIQATEPYHSDHYFHPLNRDNMAIEPVKDSYQLNKLSDVFKIIAKSQEEFEAKQKEDNKP